MPEGAPLREVLREKGTALFSGRIDVDTGGLGGVLHLSEGQILEARLGTTTGEPALWRMLLAERAKLHVEAGRSRATSGAVLGNPDALLLRFDERVVVLTRYADKVGGFHRVWAIRFDALAAALDELPDAINPLLRLLDGKRNVRHVVTECALDDMLALRILAKLLALGILVLPDDMSAQVARASVAGDARDDDDGLEAALAASLAEIDAEDQMAQSSIPPVLLARARPLLAQSTPPGPMPAPSPPGSRAPPASAALPSAPRPATNDDLRSWLGNEDAFFNAELRASPPTGDVAPATPSRFGLVPMVLLFLVAVGLGVLLSSRS